MSLPISFSALAPVMLALAALALKAPSAGAGNAMQVCNKVAEICRRHAPNDLVNAECVAQVDACMNRAQCDYAYLSCLELMEDDDAMNEAACRKARAECRKAQGRR